MLVCKHKGADIVVLSRNEHCPPHVHVGQSGWEARFTFSFCHNGVDLWDVVPDHKAPHESILEALRQVIEAPANLSKARTLWWAIHSSTSVKICLDNKYWDLASNIAVDGKDAKVAMPQIQSATYDPSREETTLTFAGGVGPLRIDL